MLTVTSSVVAFVRVAVIVEDWFSAIEVGLALRETAGGD
jgi:hypothetical protein